MNISINLTKSPDGSICPSFTVTHGEDVAKPFTLTPEGAQQTKPAVTSVDATLPLRSTATAKPSCYENIQTLPPYSGVVLPGVPDRNQGSPKPTTGYRGPGRYTTVGGHSVTIEKVGDNGRCYGSVSFDEGWGLKTVRAKWWAGDGIFDHYVGVLEGFVPQREHLRLSAYLGSQPVVDDLTRFPGPGVYKTADGKEARITRKYGDEWVGTIPFPKPDAVGGHIDVRAHWTLGGKFVRFWYEHPDSKFSGRKELDLVKYVSDLEETTSTPWRRTSLPVSGPGKYKTAEGTTVTFAPLKPGRTSPVWWGDIEYPQDSTAPRRGCWEAKTGEFIRFAGKSICDANARRHRLQIVQCIDNGLKVKLDEEPPTEKPETVDCMVSKTGFYELQGPSALVFISTLSPDSEVCEGEFYKRTPLGAERHSSAVKAVWERASGRFVRWDYEKDTVRRPWLDLKCPHKPTTVKPPAQSLGGTAVEELEQRFREVTKKAAESINKGLAEKGLTKDPLLVPGFFKTRSGHTVYIPEEFLRTLKDGMVHGFLERRDRESGESRSSNTWVVRRWNVTNGRYMNNLTETSLDIVELAATPRFIEL